MGPIPDFRFQFQSMRASGSDRSLDRVDRRHRAFRLSARLFFHFSPRAEVLDIVGLMVYDRFNNSMDVDTSICLSQSFVEFVCARTHNIFH